MCVDKVWVYVASYINNVSYIMFKCLCSMNFEKHHPVNEYCLRPDRLVVTIIIITAVSAGNHGLYL